MLSFLCNDLSQMNEKWKKLVNICSQTNHKKRYFPKITSNKRKNEAQKNAFVFSFENIA
jgi:hypothetical protein